MKRPLFLLIAVCLLVLTGCASTVRSNVTTFAAWPSTTLPDRSYVFERTKAQDQDLEYRTYENLVRNELHRIGLMEATQGVVPFLKVTLSYSQNITDVRTVQPVYVDPYFYGSGLYSRGFYGHRYFGLGFDPFFWGPPPVQYQERVFQRSRRELHVLMRRYSDGAHLYDVIVNSEGENPSLTTVMPYLVRSAFTDFPGKNGTTRIVDLKMSN